MQLNTEFKVNRMCKDLMKRKHNSVEGGTPEEVGVYKCTFYSSFRKPEICEGTLDVCWLAEQRIYLNVVHDQEDISAMLVRMTECRLRDSLNHVQGNDLGAEWIDHHDDYSYYSLLLCGIVNLE